VLATTVVITATISTDNDVCQPRDRIVIKRPHASLTTYLKQSDLPATAWSAGLLDSPPQRIGRYEILGRLACGGMAEILLGRVRGPHAFERPVVIKRMLPGLARDGAFVDMFVREARITASIQHARVVQVHELSSFRGEYFLVMEYVEGESLGGLMRRLWRCRAPLDPVLAAHIVAEACAGLHAAHELVDPAGDGRQIIHRDVSPQNVMVSYAGEVKILDFGIAKDTDSACTQGGEVKGKCEYMSPEQCRGEPLDRRSDIFSLGILLYELTIRNRLFKRDTPFLAFQAICHEPIPRPTEIEPGYPASLEAICMRALARDRRDRYPTMLEMRRDLVAAIRGVSGAGSRAGEDEQLVGLMARLFADRIEEKRDMLRRARTGSALDSMPAAEAEPDVELPDVHRATHLTPSAGSAHPRYVERRGRVGAALAGAVAVALLLGGAARWLDGGAHSPDAPAAIARPPAEPRPPGPARRERPATVRLIVESIPPGSDIFVGEELGGRAPCSLEIARADRPVTVTVRHDRFRPVVQRVVPDADQKLVVHLQPLPPIAKARRPPRRELRAGPVPTAVFEKFN
jgi:eukaryotic-like serine/threonine-protein kinase